MLTDRQMQVAIGLGVVGAVALLLYKAKSLLSDAADAGSAAYSKAKEEATAWVNKTYAKLSAEVAQMGIFAPFLDNFDPEQWRPAGIYIGDVCVLYTGGVELKPQYDPRVAGMGQAPGGALTYDSSIATAGIAQEQGLGANESSWSSSVPEGAPSP